MCIHSLVYIAYTDLFWGGLHCLCRLWGALCVQDPGCMGSADVLGWDPPPRIPQPTSMVNKETTHLGASDSGKNHLEEGS